jgi:hypothetical protein
LRAHLTRSDAGMSDADVFDFLTERAAGSQVRACRFVIAKGVLGDLKIK